MKISTKIFSIVGTDTEIGKTYVTVEILNYLNKHRFSASALKPISAGVNEFTQHNSDGLLQTNQIRQIGLTKQHSKKLKRISIMVNEDVAKLHLASNKKLPYAQISPFSFLEPIAPHITAKIEKIGLNVNSIIRETQKSIQILSETEDYILIEGVGGIMVPLNLQETYIDLLKGWQHQVILVVGMKLGCLNHALITAATLIENNINVVGWVANCIDKDMLYLEENIEYLTQKLTMPLLGIVLHEATIIVNDDFKKIFACS